MKESIGQAFIVNIILVFFGILVLLFFGSINYSKAFKAKNKIITTVEKYGIFQDTNEDGMAPQTMKDAQAEVDKILSNSGYRINTDPKTLYEKCQTICSKQFGTTSGDANCTNISPNNRIVYPAKNRTGAVYDYCVIRIDSELGSRYQVVTFMQMEVPLIGGLLRFPVRGETKILYDTVKDS